MDKSIRKKVLITLIVSILFVSVVCVLDYFNFFTVIGVSVNHINWDLLSIIIGNLVVILLFVITYFVVDNRNIQKDKNQQATAYLTLIGIYERCNDMVELFSKEEWRTKAVEKIDGNKLLSDDKVHTHYLNYPFENECIIYDFASSGILSKNIFKEFQNIKKDYQKYINTALIFFDVYDSFKQLEIDLSNDLSKSMQNLKQAIDKDEEL